MTTTAERLHQARLKIDTALDAVRSDQGASPVLAPILSDAGGSDGQRFH